MKKSLFILAALLFVGSYSFAQNTPASPKKSVSVDNVSVTYSAPSKKGRTIFGGLVPYDAVWRTGANDATKITFAKAGKLGGVDVPAGSYALFTIPKDGGDWTVILNTVWETWGSFSYNENKGSDLEHMTATVTELTDTVEQMNIAISGGNLVISWGNTSASIAVK